LYLPRSETGIKKKRSNKMPKLKTHRGAAKRFSVTGKGKIKRSKAYTSHILTPKTAKRKRQLRKAAILDKRDTAGIKRLIPYM
jgi:large subunit ribosomal protein L35